MFNKQKLISTISIILGILYIVVGVYFIISYIRGGMEDAALAYWYIPILALGIVLTIFGIFFTIIAIKSYKSDLAYKRTKIILIIAVILIVVNFLLSFLSQGTLNKAIVERQNTVDYIGQINKIDRLDIAKNNSSGFDLSILTKGEIAGKYNLQLIISDSQATFLKMTESINLNVGSQDIIKNISYNNLFRKCFTELDRSRVYVCTENTSSDSTMIIEVKLTPIQDDIDNNIVGLVSIEKIKVKLETFTKNNKVNVNNFRVLN